MTVEEDGRIGNSGYFSPNIETTLVRTFYETLGSIHIIRMVNGGNGEKWAEMWTRKRMTETRWTVKNNGRESVRRNSRKKAINGADNGEKHQVNKSHRPTQ